MWKGENLVNHRAHPEPEKPVTSSQLRAAIDSGRTGDKVRAFDPAMAPLGADEEAAAPLIDIAQGVIYVFEDEKLTRYA